MIDVTPELSQLLTAITNYRKKNSVKNHVSLDQAITSAHTALEKQDDYGVDLEMAACRFLAGEKEEWGTPGEEFIAGAKWVNAELCKPIKSLKQIKEAWAEENKRSIVSNENGKDWSDVLRDYEYAMGVSKQRSFEELMDIICIRYQSQPSPELKKTKALLKEAKTLLSTTLDISRAYTWTDKVRDFLKKGQK